MVEFMTAGEQEYEEVIEEYGKEILRLFHHQLRLELDEGGFPLVTGRTSLDLGPLDCCRGRHRAEGANSAAGGPPLRFTTSVAAGSLVAATAAPDVGGGEGVDGAYGAALAPDPAEVASVVTLDVSGGGEGVDGAAPVPSPVRVASVAAAAVAPDVGGGAAHEGALGGVPAPDPAGACLVAAAAAAPVVDGGAIGPR
ncbi:uncharacterized protein [Miscanthus floridulus]|uniref:uncharacterized protein n=1 Tax=Miscanthus floridulus TaxID=154761 RepID=UPI003459B8E9